MSEAPCSVYVMQENSDSCGIRESLQWLFVEISDLTIALLFSCLNVPDLMPGFKPNDKIITELDWILQKEHRKMRAYFAAASGWVNLLQLVDSMASALGGKCGELAVNVEKGPTLRWSNVVTTASPPFLHVINDPFVRGFPPWLPCMCVCLCPCVCVSAPVGLNSSLPRSVFFPLRFNKTFLSE